MWAAQGVSQDEIVARLQARVPDFNLRGLPGGMLNWAIPLGALALVSIGLLVAVVRVRSRSKGTVERPVDDSAVAELEDPDLADALDDELADVD